MTGIPVLLAAEFSAPFLLCSGSGPALQIRARQLRLALEASKSLQHNC